MYIYFENVQKRVREEKIEKVRRRFAQSRRNSIGSPTLTVVRVRVFFPAFRPEK